jgi:hypothetical protein
MEPPALARIFNILDGADRSLERMGSIESNDRTSAAERGTLLDT